MHAPRILRRTAAVVALALAATGVTLAAPTQARADAPTSCWDTTWYQPEYWAGVAGYCFMDGEIWWYDFNGGYGKGYPY